MLLGFENFELFVFVFGGFDAGVKLLTNFHALLKDLKFEKYDLELNCGSRGWRKWTNEPSTTLLTLKEILYGYLQKEKKYHLKHKIKEKISVK